jgi:hypothetical protein
MSVTLMFVRKWVRWYRVTRDAPSCGDIESKLVSFHEMGSSDGFQGTGRKLAQSGSTD